MSIELTVFLPRAKMPTPNAWAQAIREAGFPAQLDDDFDVDTFSGFLPCTYDGKEAGFEYYATSVDAEERSDRSLSAEHDFSVTFTTGSRMRELATSVVAAATLCQLTGGLLSDAQAGEDVDASNVLSWARDMIESMAADLSE